MQTDSSKGIGNVFGRAWQLLTANWIIILPAIIINVISSVISSIWFAPHIDPVSGTVAIFPLGMAIANLIGLLAGVLALAVTTGMADAAWKTGSATIDDGTSTLRRPNVTSALLALIAVSIVMSVLSVLSLGLFAIVEVVVFFFLIYTIAAAVHSNFGGMDALKESFEVAKTSWVTTLIVILLLACVGFLVGIIAAFFVWIPFLGPVIAGILGGISLAFTTLVIVGEYIALRPAAPTVS